MSKRRKVLLAVVCIAVVAVVAGLISHDRQPRYNGRSLEEWLQNYRPMEVVAVTPEQREEAIGAVRHIGTKALPWLLEWIRYEPAPWQAHLRRISVYRLPKWISFPDLVTRNKRGEVRAFLALNGFKILGADAAPAVPQLTEMLADTNFNILRGDAAFALAYTGTDGLAPLLQALANTNYIERSVVAGAIGFMQCNGAEARLAVARLIPCIEDRDSGLATAAIQALARLHLDVTTVAPALTNAFSSKDKDVRYWAVRAFDSGFRDEASLVAPALTNMLNDPDYPVRWYASNILARLESAPATNVPAH